MPNKNLQPPNDPNAPAERDAGADDRYRVLVVDDDSSFLLSIEAILGDHVKVVVCRTAEHAIKQLSWTRFHLVCADFQMPGMNGVELLKHVQALPYFVSTLLITGNEQYIRDLPPSDQNYVLLKPFPPARLISLVKQLCELARIKRSVQSTRDPAAPMSEPESAVSSAPGRRTDPGAPSTPSNRRRSP